MSIAKAPFFKTVKSKYLRYGTHVLGFRHFAEGRDGMTPVQRRVVWTLGHELKAMDQARMISKARVAGEVLGKYHPHEVGSIVGAMTGLSQAKSSAPLVMGIGNWGSWEDKPAAERYTACYLSKYAVTMFDSDELQQVPYDDSFDGNNRSPRFMPARLPHLMLHGSSSFGVGASGNIPPCQPAWVVDAMAAMLAGKPVASPKQFAYRWGGKLVSLDDTWIETGSGSGVFRPTMRLVTTPKSIVITSLAPRLNIDALITHLESKVESFGGVLSEPAPEDLLSVSILLRKGHDFEALKKAVLARVRTKVDYNFLYIDQIDGPDGEVDFNPLVNGPLVFLKEWLVWRRGIVKGAASYRIKGLQADTLRQELMIRVIDHRDQLLKVLDSYKDDADLRRRVKAILKCSDDEADIVMEIRFKKLAKLEVAGMRARIAANAKLIIENKQIVAKPDGRLMLDATGAVKALADTFVDAAELKKIESKVKAKKVARKAK